MGDIMYEEEMEYYLTELGYDVYVDSDDGKVLHYTLLIDYAINEGFKVVENSVGIYVFSK